MNHIEQVRKMRKQPQKALSSIPPWAVEQVEANVAGWLGGHLGIDAGHFPDKEFREWAERTVSKSTETLTYLFLRYRIQPNDVLTILALYKTQEWFYEHIVVREKLRSLKRREKDAKALETAALVLEQWWSYLTQK